MHRSAISKSYVSRILRLALLAPDIVDGIVEGKAHPALMLKGLERPLPASWEEQQIKIIPFEDISERPESTIRGLFEFLGVDQAIELDLDLVPKNSAKKSRFASPAPVMKWFSNWLVEHDQAVLLRRIRNLGIKRMLLRISTVESGGEPIRKDTGERLRRLFRDDICELETLFGLNLAAWK